MRHYSSWFSNIVPLLLWLGPILFIGIHASIAQDVEVLRVKGLVLENEEKALANATVILYNNGKIVEKASTKKSGRFEFFLELDKEYMISVSKEYYVAKKVKFKTGTPPAYGERLIQPFKCEVSIFEFLEGIDYSILDDPIGIVKYYTSSEEFDYDEDYTNSVNAALRRLHQRVKKKREILAQQYQNLSDEERAKRKEDQRAAYKLFLENRTAYNDQLKQPTQPTPPKSTKYDKLIEEADQLFTQAEYDGARKKYEEALTIKPKEQYPQQRINEIETILTQMQLQAYQMLISTADESYNKELYIDARENYLAALQLRPTEAYPRSQIHKIDSTLSSTGEAVAEDLPSLPDSTEEKEVIEDVEDKSLIAEQSTKVVESVAQAQRSKKENAEKQIVNSETYIKRLISSAKSKALIDNYEKENEKIFLVDLKHKNLKAVHQKKLFYEEVADSHREMKKKKYGEFN